MSIAPESIQNEPLNTLIAECSAGCAVALDWAVGLDIERLNRPFKVSAIRLAKHNFSASEVEYLKGELQSCAALSAA